MSIAVSLEVAGVVGYFWDSYRWSQHLLAATNDTHCTTCCQECPEGTKCTEEGVVLEHLPVKRGWWRPDKAATDVYECDYSDACTGGMDVDRQCERRGHKESVLCEVCKSGFRFDVVRLRCVNCSASITATDALAMTALLLLFVGMAVCVARCLGVRLHMLCDMKIIVQTIHKPTIARACEIVDTKDLDDEKATERRRSMLTKLKIVVATCECISVF